LFFVGENTNKGVEHHIYSFIASKKGYHTPMLVFSPTLTIQVAVLPSQSQGYLRLLYSLLVKTPTKAKNPAFIRLLPAKKGITRQCWCFHQHCSTRSSSMQ